MPWHYALWSAGVVVFAIHAFFFQRYLRVVINLFLGVSIRTFPEEECLPEGETVRFYADDGVSLAGVILRSTNHRPSGVVIFSHEFGSDKRSVVRYGQFLRSMGFHLFALDYRGHGESGNLPDYESRHWPTEREVCDIQAALRYLEGRPDFRGLPFALFGISRGGSTSVMGGWNHPRIAAIVCDGAFSTRRTLIRYMERWVSSTTRRASSPRPFSRRVVRLGSSCCTVPTPTMMASTAWRRP